MFNLEDRLLLSFFTQLGIKQFKKIKNLVDVCENKTPYESLDQKQQQKYFKQVSQVGNELGMNNDNLIDFQQQRSSRIENHNKVPTQQIDSSQSDQDNVQKVNPNGSRQTQEQKQQQQYQQNQVQQEQQVQKRVFKCRRCGKTYDNVKQLSKHRLTHPEPLKNSGIICTICQKTFKKYDEFFEHNAQHFQKQ